MHSCSNRSTDRPRVADSLTATALEELRRNLLQLSMWEKVHAAEYLIWSGNPQNVREVFLAEEIEYGSEKPYRIGIWRVLAQTSSDLEGRTMYVDKIRRAFRDPEAADRLHAAETLAKLGVPLLEKEPEATNTILSGKTNRLYVYTLWGAAIGSPLYQRRLRKEFMDLIASPAADTVLRLQAAFALRNLRGLDAASWSKLVDTALSEPEASAAYIYLLSAAYFNAPTDSLSSATMKAIHKKLIGAKDSRQKGARMEMAYTLGELTGDESLDVLIPLLNNENPLNSEGVSGRSEILASAENADVRSAAAYAILRIAERERH